MNNRDSITAGRDVWARLSECMERLDASRERTRDPAVLALKLANRAKLLRDRTVQQVQQPTIPFLTFNNGRERFGVLLSDVVEIQALDQYSPVPRMPPFIVGVIPWHGTLLTLFDVGCLFGIREAGIADYHVCVVVEAAGRRIALVAHEVEDIVGIPTDQVKTTPDLPATAAAEWITGVHDGNRLLLCLEQMLPDERFVDWKKRNV